MKGIARVIVEAGLVAVLASVVALVFNAVRPEGLSLVADRPYELFVPCPEPLGKVDELSAADAWRAMGRGKILLIDAGSETDFKGWHPEGAWNIPFDYILPVTDGDIRKIASSGASRVIVYGDGSEPDSGRELARELSGRGINNVSFVVGGAQALKAAREAR
ncbi:MAG TPA: rhodanese-like domain-containing protein [Myxococcota bacterium]|nr:rhodanese-like domain-containing protein [Myxococcota bacterium]HOD07528.1 rhodanese-like domain-containing protein [Myxococcota bacterium]HPB49839.1 rhodanese-like domain-containing protein [Myxococcota bacterium]HQP94876.1 rhodanese-like domain-containing protein [Myxococcota bacterium]